MIGIGTLTKLSKGGMGPDELQALLLGMGVQMDFQHAETRSEMQRAFTDLSRSASLPDRKVVEIRGKLKNGEQVHAMLIVG